MAQIIPKLNLNKHPSEVVNGSLIDATNIIVSNDNAVIQTEPQLDSSNINNQLINLIGSRSYTIKYCITCNKELIIFIQFDDDTNNISLYRYNEDYNETKYVTTTDYHGGNLLGTFTYNFNNLIIAFSEYFENDSNNVPLKVINIGTFNGVNEQDINQLEKSNLHSICPEVKIPNVNINYIDGSANKGWYYIFIRYKISKDTYTQWFDTNAHALVDSFNGTRFFSQYISNDAPGDRTPSGIYISYAETYVSDDTNISKISFSCDVLDRDTNYNYYQLGFICINKSTTQAYRTNDIPIGTYQFTFSRNNVLEESVTDIINAYNNYYNVKTLSTVGNRLYIANYKEHSIENEVKDKLSNINLYINEIQNLTDLNLYSEQPEQVIAEMVTDNYTFRRICNLWEDNSFYYYNAVGALVQDKAVTGIRFMRTTLTNLDENTYLTIRYGETTEQIQAKNIIIAPFYQFQDSLNNTRYGKIFINRNGILDDITPEGCPETVVYVDHDNGNGIKTYAFFVQDNSGVDYGNPSLIKVKTLAVADSSNVIKKLNTAGIYPGQYYNFFIHFVDKYGQISRGFNIGEFNVITDLNKGYNKLNNMLLYIPVPTNSMGNNYRITINFRLQNVPEGVEGYFISYEKLEKAVKLNGVIDVNNKGEICFYTDELNFTDSIDFNFNKIRIYNTVEQEFLSNEYVHPRVFDQSKSLIKYNGTYEDVNIINKELRVADSFNNVLSSTCIVLTLGERESSITKKIASLILDDSYNFYNNETKILIPCSNIDYNLSGVGVNTKTAFVSLHHAIVFNQYFYNDSLKIFQEENNTDAQYEVFTNYMWYDYAEIPIETLKFNNNPVITFFPIEGLNTEDENKKTFIVGNIVECKNTIDLYQQNNCTVDTNYPKSSDWFNPDNTYETNYPKTIRRSNIFQDESRTNAWRQFGLEQYKNITENKGDIVKLIAIGYYFIVHCQHSMFLFNGTDSIEAKENNIQLSSVDFWDTKYKEIVTSDLGYAGIQKEYSGITGNFGYVFYDSDARRIYRYDNGQVVYIDGDVTNYIRKLKGYNVHIVDDKYRNRLLICFTKDGEQDIVLSYNYNTNTFVSRHTYNYLRGYSTKENTYIVMKYDNDINRTNIDIYKEALYYNAIVNVMLNTDYIGMKYIEYILYKVAKVTPVALNNYSPVEGLNDLYAADGVRVYSTHCDTGILDTTFKDATVEVNKIMNYAKPYWRFGNWHLNALRNRLADYLLNKYGDDECSRIFGNWFVVEFHINSNEQVELETLDTVYNSAENK